MPQTLARPAPPPSDRTADEPPRRGFVDCRGQWQSLDDHDEPDQDGHR